MGWYSFLLNFIHVHPLAPCRWRTAAFWTALTPAAAPCLAWMEQRPLLSRCPVLIICPAYLTPQPLVSISDQLLRNRTMLLGKNAQVLDQPYTIQWTKLNKRTPTCFLFHLDFVRAGVCRSLGEDDHCVVFQVIISLESFVYTDAVKRSKVVCFWSWVQIQHFSYFSYHAALYWVQ